MGPQLLDLRGPRHGRQHLKGVLAVDLLAVTNVELQQSPKHLEVLELACMRQRGREARRAWEVCSRVCMRCQAHQENSSIVLRCERYKKWNYTQEEWTENSWGKADCVRNSETLRG